MKQRFLCADKQGDSKEAAMRMCKSQERKIKPRLPLNWPMLKRKSNSFRQDRSKVFRSFDFHSSFGKHKLQSTTTWITAYRPSGFLRYLFFPSAHVQREKSLCPHLARIPLKPLSLYLYKCFLNITKVPVSNASSGSSLKTPPTFGVKKKKKSPLRLLLNLFCSL